jgi:hypothetical protein
MKRFSVIVLLVAAVYIGTYICLRTSHVDRWDRDVHNYVILPESRLIYYVYRPLTYIDAHLTGMRFTSATPTGDFRASIQPGDNANGRRKGPTAAKVAVAFCRSCSNVVALISPA